jgi:hypothetical protein
MLLSVLFTYGGTAAINLQWFALRREISLSDGGAAALEDDEVVVCVPPVLVGTVDEVLESTFVEAETLTNGNADEGGMNKDDEDEDDVDDPITSTSAAAAML